MPSCAKLFDMRTLRQWSQAVGMSVWKAYRLHRAGKLVYPAGHPLAGQKVKTLPRDKPKGPIYVDEPDPESLEELARRLEAAGYRFAERPKPHGE